MKRFVGLIGIILLACTLALGILVYQRNQDVTIAKYRINEEAVNGYPEIKDFAVQVFKDEVDVTMKSTADNTRGYQIYLIQDAMYAESIGCRLPALEDDFIIRNIHSSIYIFSQTGESMKRAISYFAHNFIDEEGKITLEFGEISEVRNTDLKQFILIGQEPITSYTISYTDEAAIEACKTLRYYIQQTGNAYLDIQPQQNAGNNTIYLGVDETLVETESQIQITDGNVSIVATDTDTLKDCVYQFVNAYLGWMKAGEAEEHISSTFSSIYIPDNSMEQEAWIEEREAIVVLWNINYNRGFYLNGDTSLENNILDYSEEQLYEYIRMLKYCGFTGVQITDMCSAWAGAGGYEAVHDKIRIMADAAHSMGMNVTLWVWGAEFTGYGWVDNSVIYYEEGYEYAKDSPKVRAVFEKYYNIYAELAQYCDRVIGHFYDPGNLNTAEDIAYFCKVLRDKFYAVNPEIDFGISCWVDVYDKNVFLRELGTDITLYECGHHDVESDYESFRTYVANSGARLGTWAWNTCEMEIDQLAQMNFNMDVIRSVYDTARKYDAINKPTYWSEMDSYHVLNVFSLYCAGQMLVNPDIESEVLLKQISEATVGSEYAEDFSEILRIIQDARSGKDWTTYFWKSEDYILKSDVYDAEDILARCNTYLPILDEMIEKELEANTLPLPISLKQLLQMIKPHLQQIRDFAEFRIGFAQMQIQYANGAEIEELEQKLYEIGEPIDSYHCIIGTWGQVEARAQREMILEFCSETEVPVPIYADYDKQRKDFIYAQFAMYQRGKEEPVTFGSPYYQYGLAYTQQETNRLVQEMIEEGLLLETENGEVYLRNWENYSLHFN